MCINTGGEKVFPEEVEEVVKRFPGVRIASSSACRTSASARRSPPWCRRPARLDGEALKGFVKDHLAAYKAPKHVVQVDEVYRSPSGKADFKRTRQQALERLGLV